MIQSIIGLFPSTSSDIPWVPHPYSRRSIPSYRVSSAPCRCSWWVRLRYVVFPPQSCTWTSDRWGTYHSSLFCCSLEQSPFSASTIFFSSKSMTGFHVSILLYSDVRMRHIKDVISRRPIMLWAEMISKPIVTVNPNTSISRIMSISLRMCLEMQERCMYWRGMVQTVRS